jgi:YrbI family 3-deoxy-D-manno-octulosonate 8-phosphate phosphatase
MKIVAIIPARGGSKGIPRKNIRWLAGKPLIAHTIEQARQTKCLDRVIVSTDDTEIANISSYYGAEVVWRPAEISGDEASSESALLHVMDYLKLSENYTPDILVFLQCTSPLTLADDIDGTVQALIDDKADTALAVTNFHYFLWHQSPSGDAVGINHIKNVRLLRQQRDPQYLETGAVYAMRAQEFQERKHRFFGRTTMYVIPPERCHEVDEPVDLEIAETLLRHRQEKQKLSLLPDPIHAVVLDFDGVFTDNNVLVFQDGQEAVVCSRSDGWGLAELRSLEIPILVLSTEINSIVQTRCNKLRIPCLHGIDDKVGTLVNWAHQHHLEMANIVYLGNDVNDLACLRAVGCSVVVHDAHPQVRSSAKIILDTSGGKGAIRELIELIKQKIKERF